MRACLCVAVILGILLYPAGFVRAEGTFELIGVHPDAAVQSTDTGKILAALTSFNGKVYAGFGDYNTNTGPIGIRAFDVATNTFGVNLLNAPTEAVYQFRHIGGKLYAPDIDPNAGAAYGGYIVGTANGTTETWEHRGPVEAVHVYDVASYGGSLWMAGAQGNNAMVWRSTNNGATWATALNVLPSGGYSFVRIYGLGVYNGKLYAEVNAETSKSRVFEGTTWSDGPDLTPSGGIVSNASTFGDVMVYQSTECGLGLSRMYKFDGVSASYISNGTLYNYVADYKIVGDRMYVLTPEYVLIPGNPSPTLQGYLVKWTQNLVDWYTLATAPITSRSLATLRNQVFVGAANAELYKCSELIPEPPIFAEVTTGSDSVLAGHPYTRQLTLIQGGEPITWSVVQGPPGAQVSGTGLVSGWQPVSGDVGQTFTYQIQASNADGSSIASWTVHVEPCKADFTELFSDNNDLAHTSLTLTPDASPHSYQACTAVADAFPIDPTGGLPLNLTGDKWVKVTLAQGATVPFYGQAYSEFYVGANGYITFGVGDTDASETLADHFRLKRISGLFTDLDPAANAVTWKQLLDRAAVTFQNVQEVGTSGNNSFQIEMFYDGRIRTTWLDLAVTDGLAGISGGAGLPDSFVASNLNGYATCPAAHHVADSDGDSDVDLADFGRFQACMSGADILVFSPACGDADLDMDGDVDQSDLQCFLRCMNGPEVAIPEGCLNAGP